MLVPELISILKNMDPRQPVLVEQGIGFTDVTGVSVGEGFESSADPDAEPFDAVVIHTS